MASLRTGNTQSAEFDDGSETIESLVGTLRSLWTAAEKTRSSEEGVILKQQIAQTVLRLKRWVESRQSALAHESLGTLFLFDEPERRQQVQSSKVHSSAPPRFPDPVLRVCAKDLADHALKHLPKAASYTNLDEFRNYLTDNLRFNSQATRRRSANYIVSRFFPGDVYNQDLPIFAAANAGRQALGEALFYLTCRTEKIVSLVAEEIVLSSVAQGGIARTTIRKYIQSKFPHSKSANQMCQSVVRTYQIYGIGSASRTHLNVSLREGSLAAFAYVLHLEFPEPGMHSFEELISGPMYKWLLWDQEWMIRQLYRLREVGLLSKVSEIDRLRQFTTKYTVTDAMQLIVALAEEPSH